MVQRFSSSAKRFAPLLLAAAGGLALFSPPAFADSVLPGVGSMDGGRQFTARCADDEVLAGLAVRSGAEIDAVAPVCARALSPTTIDQASIRPYPQMFGGAGGSENDLNCRGAGPVIRALYVNAFRSDERVRAIGIYCGPVEASTWKRGEYPDASYEGNWDEGVSGGAFSGGKDLTGLSRVMECPADEVGVGIHGRSGDRVDQLGLICGDRVIKAPQVSKPAGATKPAEVLNGRPPIGGTRPTGLNSGPRGLPPVSSSVASTVKSGSASIAASHLDDLRTFSVGGVGGSPFAERCRDNEVMIGAALAVAETPDGIGELTGLSIVCAAAISPTKVAIETARISPQTHGTVADGKRVDARCGANGVAPFNYGVSVTPSKGVNEAPASDATIVQISFFCGNTPDGGHSVGGYVASPWLSAASSSPQKAQTTFTCPYKYQKEGSVAVGLYGRSGARIDRLGLICGTPKIGQ